MMVCAVSGHGVDAVEHAAADEESAGQPEHDDQRERPASGIGDDAENALAFLEVAPDQQAKAARQLHDLHQRAMLGAFRRFDAAIEAFRASPDDRARPAPASRHCRQAPRPLGVVTR